LVEFKYDYSKIKWVNFGTKLDVLVAYL
jgi:hypothetical protein